MKLALTAGIVVGASVVVERAGPLIGALVVTLPVTVWPAYVFLSLDHDAAYLVSSAQSGLAVNAVSAVFMLVYLMLAQSRGLVLSLSVAVVCWIGLASLVRAYSWSVGEAGLLNVVAFTCALLLSARYREGKVPRLKRQWYELPLRTALVCALMAVVLGLSHWAGPSATGMLAVYPISTTCTMLVIHSRLGGSAASAVVANGLFGIFGIGFGLMALALSIQPLGTGVALAFALAVPVTWNFSVWAIRNRKWRALAKYLPAAR